MSATLTLELDSFGNDALGRYARQSGRSVPDVIRLAIRYHLVDRDAPVAPAWLRDTDAAPASERIQVELDEKTWAALTAAAKRQGIDAERLAEYAYLHFLADLESGRLAKRLAESPGLKSR
jgi:hypothetical protein